jgi:polyisoprenoid-binding protein YceI
MKYILTIMLVSVLSGNLLAQNNSGASVAQQATIQFTISNAGMDVVGSMQLKEAAIKFDPNRTEESHIQVFADPSTIDSGISIRDKHLKRSDYFNIEKYPVVSLQSKKIRSLGKRRFKAECLLTIKGITRNVDVLFTYQKKKFTTYSGSLEINRLQFNLGVESSILSNKVTVTFEIQTAD